MKKSFLMYTDIESQIDLLSNEELGELYRGIIKYAVHGTPLKTDNKAVAVMFASIRDKMDENDGKYEEVCKKRAEAGRKGNLKRWGDKSQNVAKIANATNKSQNVANVADNDNDNDNDVTKVTIEKEKCKKKKVTAIAVARPLESRKKEFYESLIPFVGKYGQQMVREFFDYWSEPNQSRTKMRWELERTWDSSRRLGTWQRKENEIRQRNGNNKDDTPETRAAAVALQMQRLMSEPAKSDAEILRELEWRYD